jgi:uncharacterized protein (DUF58 family)
VAVAFATYVAARILGTWELYLLAIAFLAAVVVAWLLVARAGRRLTATRDLIPSQPTSGDELVVSFRVNNGSQLPGLLVTLPDATGDLSPSREAIEFASLGALQERSATSTALAARRGVHHLPALWADAEDPLGLVRARRRLGEPLEVTIYPRLVDLRSCALFANVGAHRGLSRRGLVRMGSSEFRGIRPHYPGEPLSHVDWKATAKTGNLMLREMDDPESGDITVLLDGTAQQVTGEGARSNFELAVEAAGSVADFVLAAGRGVNLLLHDGNWRHSRLSPDVSGYRRLLDDLAGVKPNARAPLSTALPRLRAGSGRLARTQTLAIVALALDSELVRSLISLHRDGLQVSVALVAADSFRRGPSPPVDPGLQIALTAAGVPCLTLRQGDDLRTALSYAQAERSLAGRPR